ncbi:Uncharacterised protein [Mycoplasmopsis californica]|uniref:Uncharacterized protein n=1 Tax=Mycoplasmopsis equigenitalium TaxID=114883 RepID=A0ABY5J5C0_9BACT|nr:hypothetical protein [Mycoplasmopsis equigenitalium]UUD36893.1 hypothetical protein NPA09_03275 [Mycoplasmopsis equigenitalium]VEU69812.1 Uncharacterised protein [Mycoplasmopsis californica]
MNEYKPKNFKEDTDAIIIVNNDNRTRKEEFVPEISEKDEKRAQENKMPVRLYKLHKSELTISYIKMGFHTIVIAITIILLSLQATGNLAPRIKSTSVGWYITLSLMLLGCGFFLIKHGINVSSIKTQINDYRLENVDTSVTPSFVGNSYISAARSNLVNIWLTSWINFYTLIFIAIILWLNKGSWTIDSKDGKFMMDINWPAILESGFGNVTFFVIMVAVSLGVFDILSITRYIYNYKKIKTVENYSPSNIAQYHEKANLRQLNKACLIISLVVLALFLSLVVIPLYVLFRKRRKRA